MFTEGLVMDEQTPLKQFNKHLKRPSYQIRDNDE
jgi:hypothetical protein